MVRFTGTAARGAGIDEGGASRPGQRPSLSDGSGVVVEVGSQPAAGGAHRENRPSLLDQPQKDALCFALSNEP
jgi:hypothetical protein